MGAQSGDEHAIQAVETPRLSSKAQLELERQARDAISDRATTSFIRRTLCAHNALASTIAGGDKSRNTPQPIEELLPPLTSSNEVDLQLYAIIAVIFKEFVFTWYSKITPDHVFPEEIIQIIAHCTRALEQRLRKVDLEALLLDELPDVLETHVHAYRISNKTSGRSALASSRRQIYHTLNPHPALSPVPVGSDPSSILEQRQNETAWRQLLVQGVLAVLLPTEDLENGCLRALVAEIFSEMILGGGISEKACEGWLLWEGITKVIEVVKPRTLQPPKQPDAPALDRIDLLGQETTTAKEMADGRTSDPHKTSHAASSVRISSLFWLVLQYIFLAWYTIRSILVTLATSSSLPSRSGATGSVPGPIDDGRQTLPPDVGHDTSAEPGRSLKRPVMSMRAWSCISTVIELDGRMPWLSGVASFLHWVALTGPGRVGETDGALDRLFSHHIHAALLKPELLPPLLRSVRAVLFPRNAMAAPRIPPTEAEIIQIKQRCAVTLLSMVPKPISKLYLGAHTDEEMENQVQVLLDLLGDKYCNKTLVYGIIELIVVRLIPEIGEKGIVALMEERLGDMTSEG